jgi:2-C-methyl-D-erythritol 4-phosphate cytidylyltransferase
LPSEIEALIDAVGEDAVGGLLAAAMDNTVKQQEAATGEEGQQRRVASTLDRGALWNALTPQMFRVGMLHAALSDAQLSGALTTDEASALERLGHAPLIVGGDKANIKITHASDLLLAEAILAARSTRSDRS